MELLNIYELDKMVDDVESRKLKYRVLKGMKIWRLNETNMMWEEFVVTRSVVYTNADRVFHKNMPSNELDKLRTTLKNTMTQLHMTKLSKYAFFRLPEHYPGRSLGDNYGKIAVFKRYVDVEDTN